jgi:hypothetical protein
MLHAYYTRTYRVQQDVGSLEVAVDDGFRSFVEKGQTFGGSDGYLQSYRPGQRSRVPCNFRGYWMS